MREELGFTLSLGAPLALGELGWMSTYIVDALMIGRLPNSPLAISASSLGNTIFYALVFCVIFMMNGLETLTAQAFGRGDRQECNHLLAQTMWMVTLGTPLVMLSALAVLALLPHFGTPPDIAAETSRYLHPLVWSTGPLLAYMAVRRYLQSINHVLLVTASLLTASLVNWLGDWVFLFGHLGFRSSGIAGSAYGTNAVRWYMLGLLLVGVWRANRKSGSRFRASMFLPDRARLAPLLGIGWPSGLEMLEELGISTFLSIICARLGAVLLAAHQVVLDLNAFVYQVPNGLSYATVVRVGQSAGRDNLTQVRRSATASLILGLGFMAVAAAVFAGFARFWAGLYTNSHAVVLASVPIFAICAVLLLADTTFVLLASAFTGIGDTRTPMVISFISNWAFGMPLSYFLAFHEGLALRGLWLGRAAGSVGTAVLISIAWRLRIARAARQGAAGISLNQLRSLPVSD